MHKKTVCLVGHAESTRDLIPWNDPQIDEFWGLNHAHLYPWMKKADRWFQLHSMDYLQKLNGQTDNDRKHWKWLISKHKEPIYMQKQFSECPSSVEYPIKEVRKQLGDFYTSSFAYMAALAILEGFERVEIYGFEMDSETEYFYQRDSSEYFIGLMLGKGIEVYMPNQCSLLKGDIYAFEDNSTGFLQQLELRKRTVLLNKNVELSKFHRQHGRIKTINELDEKYTDIHDIQQKAFDEYITQRDTVHMIYGAEKEVSDTMKLYKKFYNIGGGIYFNDKDK